MAGASNADEAIRRIDEIARRRLAGPQRPIQPLGFFVLAGPTEGQAIRVAQGVAEALYGDRTALRLDMAEYKEKHQIGLLVGLPPGIVDLLVAALHGIVLASSTSHPVPFVKWPTTRPSARSKNATSI
jgi:hypothetical protein